MESENVTLTCICGNVISYIEQWEAGFKYNDDGVIICDGCGREHNVNIRDSIFEIVGGELK